MIAYSIIEVTLGTAKYFGVAASLGGIIAGSLWGAVLGIVIFFIGGISRFAVTIIFVFKYPRAGFARLVHPLLLVPHVGFFFGLLRTYFPGLTFKELNHLRNIHYKVELI